MSNLATIVSTRHLAPELLAPMQAAGLHIIHADFIQKQIQIPDKKSEPKECLVLTSKTAVQAWAKLVENWQLNPSKYRVYCLEAGTKTEADRHHLPVVGTAPDAGSLADLMIQSGKVREVSFVGSDRRLDILPNKLRSQGITVDEIEAYRTEMSPVVIKDSFHGILFFSPSAIDSFISANAHKPEVCFCIGSTTAAYASQKGFPHVLIAEQATAEAMVKAVVQYYSKNPVHAQK